MVDDVIKGGLSANQTAQLYGVIATTVRKWVGRFLAQGRPALADRSSRSACSPRAIDRSKALTIIELRKKRMTQARLAEYLSLSKAIVIRVLARAGMARLSDLEPAEPVQRYEHELPGDLIHIDTTKLVRIERTGHRATGDRRDRSRGAGLLKFLRKRIAVETEERLEKRNATQAESRVDALLMERKRQSRRSNLPVLPNAGST